MPHSRSLLARAVPWLGLAACVALAVPTSPGSPQSSRANESPTAESRTVPAPEHDRSPVDLALSRDGTWLVTANQTSHTVALVDVAGGKVLDEAVVGQRPTAITIAPDGQTVLVSGSRSHDLTLLSVSQGRLSRTATIAVGCEPHGIAVSSDGKRAYVALTAEDAIAVVDLAARSVAAKIAVGRWPRYLALSPDGTKLLVGTSGSLGVTQVDLARREVSGKREFGCNNAGHMVVSPDGQHVYFPWMFYGNNPTTAGDIRRGWTLASRLTRVAWDKLGEARSLSLDPRGQAVGDVTATAISADGSQLVITAAGTHELLWLRVADLPWLGIGAGEHLNDKLRRDTTRFARIPLGGRPLGVKLTADGSTALVANYLENCVQVVSLSERKLTRSIPLGGRPLADPQTPLARRGEAVFFDAQRSLEGWYSCHSCHFEGGAIAETIDTFNDGSAFTYKTVLPLYNVRQTGPWTWHGTQQDLQESVVKSFTTSMRGPTPKAEDVAALMAFLDTLTPPPNPHHSPGAPLSAAAERGKEVFHSAKAGCATCHGGPLFTDGETHDVGLGDSRDRYEGFSTPSLVGVYRKYRLLHDGRAKSLAELLTGPHNPAEVTGQGELSAKEREDLVEYLKTL